VPRNPSPDRCPGERRCAEGRPERPSASSAVRPGMDLSGDASNRIPYLLLGFENCLRTAREALKESVMR
jgi:hypothetical protein